MNVPNCGHTMYMRTAVRAIISVHVVNVFDDEDDQEGSDFYLKWVRFDTHSSTIQLA